MKLSDAAKAMQGELIGADAEFEWVSTDTRSICSGELFFALKGENFNGEAFVERAAERGACAAVLHRAQTDLALSQIVVGDATKALGLLAKAKRQALGAKVVAISGSCGKTSVKGMLKNILELRGETCATKGNFNNHIGVPLTILSVKKTVEYLVVEAGTSGKGEIRYLTNIIDPDVAVVTNVYPAHLQGFGSIEAIAAEKSDLYVGGKRLAKAVVNHALVNDLSFKNKLHARDVLVFSQALECDGDAASTALYAENIECSSLGKASFNLNFAKQTCFVALDVPGLHQVENALAAAGCGIALGLSLEDIRLGLEAYQGEQGRMQVHSLIRGTLVDDSYNANPGSMRAAIAYLARQVDPILVLGDMGELGAGAEMEHKNIAQYAAELGIKKCLVIGFFADDYEQGFGRSIKKYRNHDELVEAIEGLMKKDSTVLVKGSRSSRMDRVCNALLDGGRNK